MNFKFLLAQQISTTKKDKNERNIRFVQFLKTKGLEQKSLLTNLNLD